MRLHRMLTQKLFRFLDNKFDSEKYRNNVRELTPAILAVLPLEYRGYLVEQDSFMARLAEMEKELSGNIPANSY
ncbi:bacteriophage regulatory protein CII [Escherichia coli]|nr:bacteriophage regulatory protein CII [Escherichia coli]